MFKKISEGFTKFFTKERILILVIFLVLAWGLITYSGSKGFTVDKMSNYGSMDNVPTGITDSLPAPVSAVATPTPLVNASVPNPNSLKSGSTNGQASIANPADLLPVDPNSQWSALNPNTMSQGNVMAPDLLQAGYHIGLDTIGQTLRNANLQLRSDPPIPKVNVAPWNMSTIEPDLGRVPLEIGQGPQ